MVVLSFLLELQERITVGKEALRKEATTNLPARGKIINRPQKFSEMSLRKFSNVHGFLVNVVENTSVSFLGQGNKKQKEDSKNGDSTDKDHYESPAKRTETLRNKKPKDSARSGKHGVRQECYVSTKKEMHGANLLTTQQFSIFQTKQEEPPHRYHVQGARKVGEK